MRRLEIVAKAREGEDLAVGDNARVYVDGVQLHTCTRVDFSLRPGEIVSARVEVINPAASQELGELVLNAHLLESVDPGFVQTVRAFLEKHPPQHHTHCPARHAPMRCTCGLHEEMEKLLA